MSVQVISPSTHIPLDLGNDSGPPREPQAQPLGDSSKVSWADSGGAVNFGKASDQPATSDASQRSGMSSQQQTIAQLLKAILEQIGPLLQYLQQLNQNADGATDSDSGNKGSQAIGSKASTAGDSQPAITYPDTSSQNAQATQPAAATQAESTAATQPESTAATQPANTAATQPESTAATQPASTAATQPASTAATQPASTAATQPASTPTPAVADTDKDSGQVNGAAGASSVGGGPVAGSGPRTFNVTNNQDQAIKIGQFDKNDKLVGELSLQPGQTGQMKYENDFTGLLKQADADGNYKPDASRLEFYNGFINTSDIDGRNASIYATDHKGFEVGDKKSIADGAPEGTVSTDSAGNKTVAGWYDGSTPAMRDGGAYMVGQLGTGMTYMHPTDDQLGDGQNPMRHTDAMTLDVMFGKA
ncbi:hypothetical protein [Pseudomonas typographi]|uniref:Uncharacterized protein n=1 Tax=Pseudomonas typographi TaxID=2715964 RepID=A0ABR7Z1C7_9PSED|nr:hypothetical protein [Pseudomonas typographi]MBD1599285.1 hypothetical protein [Pseudomonas typographi]